MSQSNEQRPSIRIGSPEAQRRILEEETGPSSSQLTADQATVPPVEASVLPEAPFPEGSTPKEDSFPPEESVPMEGSSPPQETVSVEGDIPPKDSTPSGGDNSPKDSVPWRGDNPPKDSTPSEGRSPSLVSYDDEDVEQFEAPHPSSPRESEVSPSPHPHRSSEVPTSSSTQSIEPVQLLHATKEGTGVQPSSSQKDSEVPTSSPKPSSQIPVVPAPGSSLTSTAVSGVNNLSVSPPQARDSTPSASNLPSYLSEEQRKRYEHIFSDLVDYEEPSKEFSSLTHPQVPPTAPSSEIDKVTGEVSKEYLKRHFREQRNWRHRERLDGMIQARRGTSSTPAQSTPTQTSYHASSSVHHGASRQHNLYVGDRDPQIIPEDPEAIPPTEMSNKRPPFYGPRVENDLGLWINPRIGPYLTDERITPQSSRNDPEPTYDPRPGVRFMRTTRDLEISKELSSSSLSSLVA
ncbi:hypothetical protein P9112_001583 [Eukaryota sp. TZLM1-RC]